VALLFILCALFCVRVCVCGFVRTFWISLLWLPCGFFFFLFFPRLISAVADWMSAILPHMMWPYCEFRMQVWNVLHVARWKYRTQRSRQKSPSVHHRTALSGYIFATKARIDNWKKNLLSSNTSCTPHALTIWRTSVHERLRSIDQFGAPLQISPGFASWQRYCTASSSGRQPNFAALNRERHLYSAGRPSRWHWPTFLVVFLLSNSK